jgi:5'-nucleotidase
MKERLTVLVDMDGVLADFDTEVLARMKERYPHIPQLPTRENFYVADDYPEHSELVRGLSNEQGFFDNFPVADGALEGWQRMIDLGYDPRICSSPITTNPHSTPEKLNWLNRHFAPVFGAYVVRRAIITRDKHLHDGIALIDDRPEVAHADEASWKHIVFDMSYNQSTVTELRLHGWHDDRLPDLLEMAAAAYEGPPS